MGVIAQSRMDLDWIDDASPFVDHAEALEMWRAAAGLVESHWQAYLVAKPQRRAWAFAFYVAALDAEEAAAAAIAARSSSIAA